MTTTTITPSGAPIRRLHTGRSEWLKLRTLRSTWITLAGTAVLAVVLAAIGSASEISSWDEMTPAQQAAVDPLSTSLIGVLFTTVFVGALAIRSVTAEYATGMIRVTFAATPTRRQVLLAKAGILAGFAVPFAVIANVASFVVGQGVLARENADAAFGDPGVTQAIVLGAVAVGVVAILGVGLGSILRRTAMATTVLTVAIVGSQLVAIALPASARKFLPGSALQAVVSGPNADDLLDPVAALLSLAAYALVAMAIALVQIERRDA